MPIRLNTDYFFISSAEGFLQHSNSLFVPYLQNPSDFGNLPCLSSPYPAGLA
jgi:hypothetical protein